MTIVSEPLIFSIVSPVNAKPFRLPEDLPAGVRASLQHQAHELGPAGRKKVSVFYKKDIDEFSMEFSGGLQHVELMLLSRFRFVHFDRRLPGLPLPFSSLLWYIPPYREKRH
jgi:hypothetical protein